MERLDHLARGFVSIFAQPFNFEYESTVQYMQEVKWTTFWISMSYVVVVFLLKAVMANFKPFKLTSMLNFWNCWLAIFSVLGSIAVGVQLFTDMFQLGFDATACTTTPVWHGVAGWYQWLFAMSKIAEFGDTILIVLRKKPLIFLHWYHHVFTMNYAIMSYVERQGYNAHIVWLNLTVHAIMYSYYMARSMGIQVKAVFAQCITMSQISQFIITLAIQARTGYLLYAGAECNVDISTWNWCLFMEISYVILFGNFFYQSYVKGGGKKYIAEKTEKKMEQKLFVILCVDLLEENLCKLPTCQVSSTVTFKVKKEKSHS